MPAFTVEHPRNRQAVVVIEKTAGKARAAAIGDDLFCDCEFLDPIVKRAKEFDKYKKAPTVKQLVDRHGWWFECNHCGDSVADHTEDRKWIGNYQVFCNYWCRAAYRKKSAKPKWRE